MMDSVSFTLKHGTKELLVIVNIDQETSLPLHLRQEAARGIQAERPWSSLDPDILVEQMHAATEAGCYDILVYDQGSTVLQGWAQFAEIDDIHVGLALSVMAMYVRPEYRDAGVAKSIIWALKHLARETGIRWCVYSHWAKPKTLVWRYIDLGE